MTTPLPPIDPSTADDKLPGEAELASLYRQLPRSEPGAALDAAVLQAAAAALGQHERPQTVQRGERIQPRQVPLRDVGSIGLTVKKRGHRMPRWMLTLGSAASLVLVAGVAWHMRGTPTESMPNAESSNAISEPVAAMPIKAAVLATPAAPTENMATNRQAVAAVGVMAAKPAAAAPAMHAMKIRSDSATVAGAITTTHDKMVRTESRESSAASRHSSLHDDKAGSRLAAAADRANVGTPQPPAPVAEVSAQVLPAPAPVPPAPAARPAPPAMPVPAQMTSPPLAQNVIPAQPRELNAIRKLFAEHHDDEAQRRLAAFRQAYPQWELPADLQAHLRKP